MGGRSEVCLSMSEKYMSIGAPMTELPLAQPRGHTSHSQRATSAMAGGAKSHDSCYNSHSSHSNGVSLTPTSHSSGSAGRLYLTQTVSKLNTILDRN